MSAIHDITVTTIDGRPQTLADYAGKVLLIVNVASKCGLTPQYEKLEKLYERLRGQGLAVLGFPSNEFGGQEPGSEAEIQAFCQSNYGVQFPMFSKISVNGAGRHPLYAGLIGAQPRATENPEGQLRARLAQHGRTPADDSDILWNFEKFLVNRKGEVVGRFAPDVAPDDVQLVEAIEAELARG
jgi:glutathione peroxidase